MSGRSDALRRLGGLKWTGHDEDVLAAWVAEMDFGLAPPITSALHDAIDRGLTGYPFPDLEHSTAVAATEFWRSRFGWRVSPDVVAPAPDVIEGVRRAIVHLTRPESPVIVHSPVYFPFYGMIEGAGRDIVEVRCRRNGDGEYELNLDAIDRALDDGAGSIVLCNPWNPTGRVFSHAELGDLAEIVARHDARVIADEIHSPITLGGSRHIPMATLDPDRTVTVASASKAWNLPGLKCAQVVLTNEDDLARWSAHFTPDKVGVGTLGLVAATAAYSDGVPWLETVLDRLEHNRDLLVSQVGERLPRAAMSVPQGTYLAWIDLTAYEIDDPADYLLDRARVALTGGLPFGTGVSGFARFNFATEPDLIVEMVDRMAAALAV